MRRTVFVFLLLTACSRETAYVTVTVPAAPPTTPAETPAPAPAAAKPPTDPRLVEFKTRVLAFAEEAGALANLMENEPSFSEYDRRFNAASDAYLKINDPPANSAHLPKVKALCEETWTVFRLCRDYSRQGVKDFKNLAQKIKLNLELIRDGVAIIK